jgi:hypothetical protein
MKKQTPDHCHDDTYKDQSIGSSLSTIDGYEREHNTKEDNITVLDLTILVISMR